MKYVGKAFLLLVMLVANQACNNKEQVIPESELLNLQALMMEKIRAAVLTADPDSDFATIMQLSNEISITIANKELQSGRSARMQAVAREVISGLKAENEEIEKLLKTHQGTLAIPEFREKILLNIERAEKSVQLQTGKGNIDKDFATIMILQNQGAIENVHLQTVYGTHLPLKTYGRAVTEKRDLQNRYLQSWLLGIENPD